MSCPWKAHLFGDIRSNVAEDDCASLHSDVGLDQLARGINCHLKVREKKFFLFRSVQFEKSAYLLGRLEDRYNQRHIFRKSFDSLEASHDVNGHIAFLVHVGRCAREDSIIMKITSLTQENIRG